MTRRSLFATLAAAIAGRRASAAEFVQPSLDELADALPIASSLHSATEAGQLAEHHIFAYRPGAQAFHVEPGLFIPVDNPSYLDPDPRYVDGLHCACSAPIPR